MKIGDQIVTTPAVECRHC